MDIFYCYLWLEEGFELSQVYILQLYVVRRKVRCPTRTLQYIEATAVSSERSVILEGVWFLFSQLIQVLS